MITATMAFVATVPELSLIRRPVSHRRDPSSSSLLLLLQSTTTTSTTGSSNWFASLTTNNHNNTTSSTTGTLNTAAAPKSLEQHKAILLHLGAILDRGQAYNPTSGEYYKERMEIAIQSIKDLLQEYPNKAPQSLSQISGEWELILSTVPHGIFRSSPFFLAIQEAYYTYAEEKEAFGMNKADLFFKLHELQTCSWGISKVGRVAQHIVVESSHNNTGYLYSEFDTSIFSLTVIPILGWFKLLPTFGGCVVTAAKCTLLPPKNDHHNATTLQMIVDYTTARPVPGLSGLGEWIWKIQVPVNWIWKLLPWNQKREPICQVFLPYVDEDFRIVQDVSGDYFVYTRPVIPRPLDLVAKKQPVQAI